MTCAVRWGVRHQPYAQSSRRRTLEEPWRGVGAGHGDASRIVNSNGSNAPSNLRPLSCSKAHCVENSDHFHRPDLQRRQHDLVSPSKALGSRNTDLKMTRSLTDSSRVATCISEQIMNDQLRDVQNWWKGLNSLRSGSLRICCSVMVAGALRDCACFGAGWVLLNIWWNTGDCLLFLLFGGLQ